MTIDRSLLMRLATALVGLAVLCIVGIVTLAAIGAPAQPVLEHTLTGVFSALLPLFIQARGDPNTTLESSVEFVDPLPRPVEPNARKGADVMFIPLDGPVSEPTPAPVSLAPHISVDTAPVGPQASAAAPDLPTSEVGDTPRSPLR